MINSEKIYVLILVILIANYLVDILLNYLNARNFGQPLAPCVQDIYDGEAYKTSQKYKRVNYKLDLVSSSLSFVAIWVMVAFGGFAYLDGILRSVTAHPICLPLLFFLVLMLLSQLLSLPLRLYRVFVVEQKFGFNKMTRGVFFSDMIKKILLTIVFGGGLLAVVIWLYQKVGVSFWLYAWGVMTVLLLLINMLYTKLIVPLFNKQSPLEDGALKVAIVDYAKQVSFSVNNIFIIDGSKRSTKANAYFSGFGRSKRINLYDTLVADLTKDELVAVLAHEVGHYKKRHIVYNTLLSIFTTGGMLYLFSLCVQLPSMSLSLGVSEMSFHIGLLVFAILYTPVSSVFGVFTHWLSRVFEYQADNYAKATFGSAPLVSALKKMSSKHLSNLTPHPWYVAIHYSHPPLDKRISNLES